MTMNASNDGWGFGVLVVKSASVNGVDQPAGLQPEVGP